VFIKYVYVEVNETVDIINYKEIPPVSKKRDIKEIISIVS